MSEPKACRTPEQEAQVQRDYAEYRARMDRGSPGIRLVLAVAEFGAVLAVAEFLWPWLAGQG